MALKELKIRFQKLNQLLFFIGLSFRIVAVGTVLIITIAGVIGFSRAASKDGSVATQPSSEERAPSNEHSSGLDQQTDDSTAAASTNANNQNVVFIYHSHNRESWIPELGVKDANDAFDPKKNITLVGNHLADKLEQLQIPVIHTTVDYPTSVTNFKYPLSYMYSKKTVQEVISHNSRLEFIFDLHRDSGPRDQTTVTIKGNTYAQLFFIIGHKNPNWQQNEEFALSLHNKIEEIYPGLSRGIWEKSSHNGNGEYNQTISPHSLLIEIGGPYNTLEECNRTADILAQEVADIHKKADKVHSPSK